MNEINEMGPTKKDLIVASSGRDDVNDIPCASCILFCDILHADGTEAESVTEKLMVTPEVRAERCFQRSGRVQEGAEQHGR